MVTLFVRLAYAGVILVAAGSCAMFGYRFVRADVAADVYRQRLVDLAGEYDALRDQFNEAVRRTAVTELLVEELDDGSLTLDVRVRSQAGTVERIETPFDPRGEIYVDYIVREGRLWIRRVFDDKTAPGDGLVIEPVTDDVDWDEATVGKAVYRSLDPGRWVVTVTGTGSLGLVRVAGEGDGEDLQVAPAVRDYSGITDQADGEVDSIGWDEVWGRLTGDGPEPARDGG